MAADKNKSFPLATLDDKYTLDTGRVYLTGNQALVRLVLMQHERDASNGLNSAGYVTGYRGSPIGTFDLELGRAKKYLADTSIVFEPGVNEDLAATAVWGTQQLEGEIDKAFDGVFALWYAKGPGVFRSGDALKHGSFYGASPNGGVLLLAGDDHTAKSSTVAYSSEPEMIAHGSPVFYPSNTQEILQYGLQGWALSRYSGAWVTLKVVNETIEATGTVNLDVISDPPVIPSLTSDSQVHFNIPPGSGLEAARNAERMAFTARLPLIEEFARSNKINRCTIVSERRRLGIVAAGKTYNDVRRALQLLGISHSDAEELGISLFKVGMIWPLEPQGFAVFADKQEEILVVEEKLPILEQQIARQLVNWPDDIRPRLVGQRDELANDVRTISGTTTPAAVANVIGARLIKMDIEPERVASAINRIERRISPMVDTKAPSIVRMPWFCSGCPHNRSTVVPEGSITVGGIGCHSMAAYMNRSTRFPTHMGGEGHTWAGMTHFVKGKHRFQNLGDGTYSHSGLLALHAAAVQGVNITYKILYNDAVAMTGGQAVEGQLTPQQISTQCFALGAKRVVVTTDDPGKYKGQSNFAKGTTVHHRSEIDILQRELRETEGVTVLIHDQTCAAEKRRRRKRGTYPDPPKRQFINQAVCEACGDCSVVSNCVSIQTRKTEFGNKRVIDQWTCNKDYSCNDGFCPSFVTVIGGELRKVSSKTISADIYADLPCPEFPEIDGSYAILINGIGGTGVVTIAAVIGMAAHLEGKYLSIYDMAGLAQKGGAVLSHLRIARDAESITSVEIGPGDADLLLGCDLVVSASEQSIRSIHKGHTKAVINDEPVPTAALQLNREFELPTESLTNQLRDALGSDVEFVGATSKAVALMGDSIAANMFVVGFAWQKGLLPLGEASILKAIELNGVAVSFNHNAFQLGRVAAFDASRFDLLTSGQSSVVETDLSSDLEEAYQRRIQYLEAYQNKEYATEYAEFVAEVRKAEASMVPGRNELSEAVIRNYFKLKAYKDEYEVARLYTDGSFLRDLHKTFDGKFSLRFNMAPLLLARKDRANGYLRKREYGAWVMFVFRVLARLKFLRGTKMDLFGYTQERRSERQQITEYKGTVRVLLDGLHNENYDIAVQVASMPDDIRGYGHVKAAAVERVAVAKEAMMAKYKSAASGDTRRHNAGEHVA